MLRRTLFRCTLTALTALGAAACSSSPGANPTLPSAPSDAQANGLRGVAAATPAPTFPPRLNVFPTTLKARPICQVQTDNSSVQCQANQNPSALPIPNASAAASQIPGLQPAQLAQQYGFNPSSGGTGQTVAVIVAFNSSLHLQNDLNVYRAAFGLGSCTVANGCLTIVNQNPSLAIPDPIGMWPIESDLDVEMVSAVCPKCKILVAQALDRHLASMAATVDTAVADGATAVSISWSLPESAAALAYASHFVHPGVPITAGSGDGGYAVGFPADLNTVIGVGGTTLNIATHQESVWPLTGSGCSALVAKPAFQTDSGCSKRTTNDVSVVADPATGVAVYSTVAGGWVVMGGTSIGAPVVASMYALQGNGKQINDATSIYAHASSFNAIASGSNGTCSPAYLCTATGAYSGPAGLGTPKGTAGF
jgi:subtilase family serine protease